MRPGTIASFDQLQFNANISFAHRHARNHSAMPIMLSVPLRTNTYAPAVRA